MLQLILISKAAATDSVYKARVTPSSPSSIDVQYDAGIFLTPQYPAQYLIVESTIAGSRSSFLKRLKRSHMYHAFIPCNWLCGASESRVSRAFLSDFSWSSSNSTHRFSMVRYVCHPMAINPAKILRYGGSINVKLNAVTAGQSLQLLTNEVGTVLVIRSHTSGRESPDRSDCMPKK